MRRLSLTGLSIAGMVACGASTPPSPPRVAHAPASTAASTPAPEPAPEAAPPPDPAPAPEAAPPPPPPKPMLSTRQFQSWIWEHPRYEKNGMIGFLRAGARAVRSAEPYTEKDAQPCGGTWYKLEPAGFVCVGKDGVTLDLDDPVVVAASKYGPKAAPLPYGYGKSMGAALYARVPTADEQKASEGDVAAWRKQLAETRAKTPPEKLWPETAIPIEPMPSFLENHAQAPAILPGMSLNKSARGGWGQAGTRLAFVAAFESEGRAFYLTTEHLIVAADRVRAAKLADFHGVELGKNGEQLPMVWVRIPNQPAVVYKLDGDTLTKTDVTLGYQQHAEIKDDDVTVKGAKVHVLKHAPAGLDASGTYVVKSNEATRLDAAKERPDKVAADERWIEVSLSKQTMVVYDGLTPTFATLVSTGSGGKTHSTPWGHFRVYQKHWSSRMEAPEKPAEKEGDEAEHAYRYDDVPYVQYLVGGIAIHAAFWHDGFGLPRSHGCINLSPRDAQTIFGKTSPALPQGWHGMAPGRAGLGTGTMVVIRG